MALMKPQRTRSKHEDAWAGIVMIVIELLFAVLACYWLAETKLQLLFGLGICAIGGVVLFWVHHGFYKKAEKE